jgi:4,5-DOPA dioxygenase extradiol
MPVVFVGHGSPMNVVLDNVWSRGFAGLSGEVPEPAAILAVSAHWYVGGTYVTGNASPRTIHDFSGFPQALYEIQYPAPGHLDLAKRVRGLLREAHAALSADWGLDHGTWSVLKWMYPDARIPVIQLSIDRRLSPERHLEIGRSLAELREEGVLILGSGNVTHNLRDAFTRLRKGENATPDWARRFDAEIAKSLEQHDTARLLTAWRETDDGRRSHPTADHYLPLLYTHGATWADEPVRFPIEGFDIGSISMRAVVVG